MRQGLIAVSLFAFACIVFAQQNSGGTPQLQQREPSPAVAAPQTSPAPAASSSSLSGWQRDHFTMFATDFGQLARYRAANAALPPPAAGEKRVIFFGDSITDLWKLDQYFPGKGYINRGIGGQTTSQMLVRLRQDVIDLHPALVVVLAGTNDIAGNTGPISTKDIEANLATFAELTRLHKIKVIFSSVTPVNNYTPNSQALFKQRPVAEILELNRWMQSYSNRDSNISFLNYYPAMLDRQGMMRKDLTVGDGLHPSDAGYKIMAPLAEAAIEKALSH